MRILAGGSPPDRPRVHKCDNVKVTAGELRKAIAVNPDHPNAIAFSKGVASLPDDCKLGVEKEDILGLIEDRDVHTDVVDGVQTKRLGEPRTAKPSPKPTPTPAPKPDAKPNR